MIKISITTTYNDQHYDSIAEAAKQAIMEGFRENLAVDLEPFKKEIETCGGEVEIVIQEDLKGANVQFHNLPDELIDRISAAMEQNS
jgi:lipoate-protein ligase B